jgi:hypothetical protein
MLRVSLIGLLAGALWFPAWATAESNGMKDVLAFEFSSAKPGGEPGEKFPYFRVFPGGKDKNKQDASGSLNTLKFARGESKLYKDEDAKPGLIVVLRRILFVPLPSGDYKAILEGEYNAVQTRV